MNWFKRNLMKRMNKKNGAKNILGILNNFIVFQLIFSPISSALAESTADNVINTGLETISQIGTGISNIQNQNQQQQMANQMANMQRSQVQAIIPTQQYDPYFGCKMLPKKGTRIGNLCQKPPSSPQEAQFLEMNVITVIDQNMNAYENIMIPTSNLNTDTGIKCLDENKKRQLEKIQLARKKIEEKELAFNDAYNKLEKTQAENMMDNIQNLHAELEGGDGASTSGAARDFSKILNDSNCRSNLNQADINGGKNKGLRSIKTDVEGENGEKLKDAQKLLSSQVTIENDVKQQALAVKNYINTKGPGAIEELKDGGISKIPGLPPSSYFSDSKSLNAPVVEKSAKLSDSYKQVSGQLNSLVGYSIDGDVSQTDIVAQMKRHVDKKKRDDLTNCLYSKELGISREILFGNLEQLSSKNRGTKVTEYSTELGRVISKNQDANTLTTEMANLESKYENRITLKINKPYCGRDPNYDWKTSELMGCVKSGCDTNFENVVDATTGLTRNKSYARANEMIEKYKTMQTNFQNEIYNSIVDRTINCTGITYNSSPDQCNGDKLKVGSSSFCVKQSAQCAANIQSCYNTLDTEIKKREIAIKATAVTRNNLIKTLKQKQDIELKKIKMDIDAVQISLGKALLGSDLFKVGAKESDAYTIKMPKEKMNAEFGVALIEEDDPMEEFNTKIKNAKEMLSQMEEKVGPYFEKIENEYKDYYAKEQEYWASMKEKCLGKIGEFNKAQADAAAAEAERQATKSAFCANTETFSATPPCDSEAEALSDSMADVIEKLGSDAITKSDKRKLRQISATCRNAEEAKKVADTNLTVEEFGDKCLSDADCKKAYNEYLAAPTPAGTTTAPPEKTFTTFKDGKGFEYYNKFNTARKKELTPVSNTSNSGQSTWTSCNDTNDTGTRSDGASGQYAEVLDFIKEIKGQ